MKRQLQQSKVKGLPVWCHGAPWTTFLHLQPSRKTTWPSGGPLGWPLACQASARSGSPYWGPLGQVCIEDKAGQWDAGYCGITLQQKFRAGESPRSHWARVIASRQSLFWTHMYMHLQAVITAMEHRTFQGILGQQMAKIPGKAINAHPSCLSETSPTENGWGHSCSGSVWTITATPSYRSVSGLKVFLGITCFT